MRETENWLYIQHDSAPEFIVLGKKKFLGRVCSYCRAYKLERTKVAYSFTAYYWQISLYDWMALKSRRWKIIVLGWTIEIQAIRKPQQEAPLVGGSAGFDHDPASPRTNSITLPNLFTS